MSLIFETKTLTTPGVYTFTIPSGVGDIEVHLWGGGGGDGASGKNRTVVLNPGRAEQSTASGSRTYTSGQGVFTVPDLVTSISVSVVGGGGGGGNYH